MAERFAFRLSQMPTGDDPARQVMTLLIGHGLPPADAQRLVENELTITPTTGIKKLSELLEGRAGEGGEWIEASEESKGAGAKLMAFLRWDGISCPQPEALTKQERELAVERGFDVGVREGFFERVAGYAGSTEQLAAILRLFKPTVTCGDHHHDKTSRLIAAAAELLGTSADGTDAEMREFIGAEAGMRAESTASRATA